MKWLGWHEDWRIAEMLMGVASIAYGFWLALPPDTFGIGPTTVYVEAIGLPDWAWGIVFLLTGTFRVCVTHRRRHTWRKVSALVDVVKWAAWWLLLFVAQPFAGFPSFCLVFAIASILSCLSSVNCEVIAGRCNGLLEHRIQVLAERLTQRSRSEPP